jgi:hypothetical protein
VQGGRRGRKVIRKSSKGISFLEGGGTDLVRVDLRWACVKLSSGGTGEYEKTWRRMRGRQKAGKRKMPISVCVIEYMDFYYEREGRL